MGRKLTDSEIIAQIPAARAAGRRAEAAQPQARSARYDRGTGRVEVELSNGCAFSFPADLAQGLRGATPEQLEQVEVVPGGDLHWEALDADHHVADLLLGVFGSEVWMRAIGKAGGSRRSAAKAAASRANGSKGGRPRKVRSPDR